MIIDLPPELKILQEPWRFDYDKELLECKDRLLERFLRIGGNIWGIDGHYQVLLWHSGGGGTFEGTKVDRKTCEQICEIAKKELLCTNGIFDVKLNKKELSKHEAKLKIMSEKNAAVDGHKVKLEAFLSQYTVSLEIKNESVPPEAYRLALETYKLLPEHHFGHSHFKELKLGGWGNGAAKFSAYENPVVHIFDCAIKGVRRNYLGLLLHETGHSFCEYLREQVPNMYTKAKTNFEIITKTKETGKSVFEVISNREQQGNSFPVVDYLHGKDSRRDRLLSSLSEFIAELYLIYVSNGEELRQFVTNTTGEEGLAWKKTYLMFKTSFRGKEYR